MTWREIRDRLNRANDTALVSAAYLDRRESKNKIMKPNKLTAQPLATMNIKSKLRTTTALLVVCIGLFGCGPKQGTVHWESKLTGYKGHGQPIDYQTAKVWADKKNRDHPHLRHWVE